MFYRILPTLMMLSLLAGCAATGQGTGSDVAVESELPPAPIEVASSTATIDEHLFVPAPEPTPTVQEAPFVHSNVYERMTDNFALPECSENDASLQWAKWYAERPEYMERVLKRAQPWIYYITDQIEKRGMPGELALLPIVESAYDPFAYSSGQALGTWQFIASTGKHYGLSQDWWYDGRRDVWASTNAALDYLAYMADMFDGDWLLALAGYNSGENRVARQTRKNRSAGKPADFWNLKLPRETRGYIPKLLGLTCLFKYPETYAFTYPSTPNHEVVRAVDIGQQADLVLVAQMADVPIDILFSLNPGYSRFATSPEGPWRVVLPIENAQLLEATLQKIDASALMKWDQLVVQSGDTLSGLSARHNVPVSVLRTSNNIHGDLINVGQKLRLPRDSQMMADPLYVQSARELAQLQSGLIASDQVTHRVRSGESLSVIARRYRVSVKDLQRWNNISNPRKLRAGTTLTVFHSPAQQSAPASGTVQHVVKRGDSLWSIARKYNVKISDLTAWNSMSRNSVLQPGQALKVKL